MISSSALLFPLSAYRSLLLPVFLGVLVGCTAKPSFAESLPTDRTDSTEQTVIFVEDEVLLPPYVVVQSDSVVSINGRVVGRIYPATPTPPGTAMDSLYTATFRVFRSIQDAGLGLVAATDSAASFLSTSSLVDSVAVLGAGVLSTYSTDLPGVQSPRGRSHPGLRCLGPHLRGGGDHRLDTRSVPDGAVLRHFHTCRPPLLRRSSLGVARSHLRRRGKPGALGWPLLDPRDGP